MVEKVKTENEKSISGQILSILSQIGTLQSKLMNLLNTDKYDKVTQKGKFVFDIESLQSTFELVDLAVKRILNSNEEDKKPAKCERLGVKPPFTRLPSFHVSALVLSYKCYKFEAVPLL